METWLAILFGLSLAACAGLRAWLPLLTLGLLGRYGVLELNPALSFVSETPALVVFGVATVLEILGDKIIAVDHLLDTIGTIIRPIAGMVAAGSVLTQTDPTTTAVLSIVVGGGAALTVHSAKAAVRAHSTAFAPLHAGLGNAGLSLLEDLATIVGLIVAVLLPLVAGLIAIVALIAAVCALVFCIRSGVRLFRWLTWSRRDVSTDAN